MVLRLSRHYFLIQRVASAIGLTVYAILAARAGKLLSRGKIRRVVDFVMGAILMALGTRLAIQKV